MHVHPGYVVCCAPEVEINTPERRTKRIGKPRPTLMVQRIGLSKNEWEIGIQTVWQLRDQAGIIELLGDGNDL
jgi:hypothetical protein